MLINSKIHWMVSGLVISTCSECVSWSKTSRKNQNLFNNHPDKVQGIDASGTCILWRNKFSTFFKYIWLISGITQYALLQSLAKQNKKKEQKVKCMCPFQCFQGKRNALIRSFSKRLLVLIYSKIERHYGNLSLHVDKKSMYQQ